MTAGYGFAWCYSKITDLSLTVRIVVLLSICCQFVLCSSSRYYIQPADEKQGPKQVAVLKLPSLHKIAIDDNDVTGFDLIYMVPGWHHISFGWPQDKGCAKKQIIHYTYRYAGIGVKVPGADRTQVRCVKRRVDYVNFSGWWEFSAGDSVRWGDISDKLTTTQNHRDEVDNLADAYRNGDLETRMAAVKRLGEIRNIRVIYILLRALRDEEDSIKIEACRSLKKHDNQYAVSFIKELRKNTKAPGVKSAANDALRSLTGYDTYR